jgi:c(7)-type cytochrome triheme protein
MPYKTSSIKALLIIVGLLIVIPPLADGQWELPPLPPPDEYGTFLMNRTSTKNNVEPAVFSHWIHRRKHTCRVCHFELEFSMQRNTTEITEKANREGKFCGACHDDVMVFGHGEAHCKKCHNNNLDYGNDKFPKLLGALPKAPFGNGRDWSRAIEDGLIKPDRYLKIKPLEDITFTKELVLEAEWRNVPPAVFSHKKHVAWLDCNNCHPDIFNIKKKTTKHFTMKLNLDNQFCGVCHLKVAFPMNDCKRCHPKMKMRR